MCSPTCGTSTSRAIPTSSRSTSATCGASSTSRSAGGRSRPSGVPATVSEPMTGRPTWRSLTIRARITIAAVTVVAAALAAAGLAITVLEERSLVAAVDDGVRAQSADVVAEVAGGHLPPGLAVSAEHETLVQVLDAEGR